MAQRTVIACTIALIALGLAWELFLAPLRPAPAPWASALGLKALVIPASWLLSLKVLPLGFALPGFLAGRIKVFQWWSMAILLYLAEGLVRATSEGGISHYLAWLEVALSTLCFVAILAFVRQVRARH